MKSPRSISCILWALSVLALVIGGISRVGMVPIAGITARAFLGLAILFQLYAMSLLIMELVQQGRR